jgi:hypothetical protein
MHTIATWFDDSDVLGQLQLPLPDCCCQAAVGLLPLDADRVQPVQPDAGAAGDEDEGEDTGHCSPSCETQQYLVMWIHIRDYIETMPDIGMNAQDFCI